MDKMITSKNNYFVAYYFLSIMYMNPNQKQKCAAISVVTSSALVSFFNEISDTTQPTSEFALQTGISALLGAVGGALIGEGGSIANTIIVGIGAGIGSFISGPIVDAARFISQ